MNHGASENRENRSAKAVCLRFWGVRGSIPTPGRNTVAYGGNTPCVEVRADGEIIVLDAGSGIRPLGLALREEFKDRPLNLTLLITHTHWDHIQGFPFFAPAYNEKNNIRVLGLEGARQGLETTLKLQMENPFFPIALQQLPGNISIQEISDFGFSIGAVNVQAHLVNHTGICAGYRLNTSAGSICYIPDVELPHPAAATPEQRSFAEFVRNADVLIIDSQYRVDEYNAHVGWGHSCVDASVEFAAAANVKQLFLFHHDPTHTDAQITELVGRGKEIAAKTCSGLTIEAAREGLEVTLPA